MIFPTPLLTSSAKVIVRLDAGPILPDNDGVGNAVSTASDKLLLPSLPSALALPASSLNLLLATLMFAVVVLPSAGVKVAVYTVFESTLIAKLDKVPAAAL